MKYERDQPNAHRNEWSPLQNGSEASSSHSEDDDSSSSKKKKRGVLFGVESPADKPAKKSKESTSSSSELDQAVISEGDIWIRAASNRVRQPAEADKPHEKIKAEKDQGLESDEVESKPEDAELEAQQANNGGVEDASEPDQESDIAEDETNNTESQEESESEPEVVPERPQLVRGESKQWQQQPEQQAQARDEDQPEQFERLEQWQDAGNEYDDAGQPGYGQAEVGEPFMYDDYAEPAVDETRTPNPFERNEVPPLPPAPSEYRRVFWQEAPAEQPDDHSNLPPVFDYRQAALANQTLTAQEATSWTRPSIETAAPYGSDLPPGLQRSPREVSRAAWTGLIAGWFFGRRGKNKAVSQARKEGHNKGFSEGQRAAVQVVPYERPRPTANEQSYAPYQPLEAAPLHNYPQQESGRISVQPTAVESRPSVAPVFAAPESASSKEQPRKEAAPKPMPEAPAAVPGARSERALEKAELMRLAKDIKVDGIRLKDVYDAKRIDEAGLRAVVETYLRGGDIKQQLTQEVIAKEQSYERDPLIRHQRSSGQVAGAIAKAASLAGVSKEKAKQATQSVTENVKKGAKQAQRDVIENSGSEMWIMVTVAVIIYAIIALLLFN